MCVCVWRWERIYAKINISSFTLSAWCTTYSTYGIFSAQFVAPTFSFFQFLFACCLTPEKNFRFLFDAFFHRLFLSRHVCVSVCLFKRIIMYVCFTHFTSTLFTIYIIKNTQAHTHTIPHHTKQHNIYMVCL